MLKNRGVRSVYALPLTTVHGRLGGLAVGSLEADAHSKEEVRFQSHIPPADRRCGAVNRKFLTIPVHRDALLKAIHRQLNQAKEDLWETWMLSTRKRRALKAMTLRGRKSCPSTMRFAVAACQGLSAAAPLSSEYSTWCA